MTFKEWLWLFMVHHILLINELGEREYLVGDSDYFPEVPKGYKLIEKFPFGRFRSDKIGTGEGAQAFGWGLYFTDLVSIARNYANVLAGRDYTITLDELKINGKVIKNKEVLQLFKDAIEGFTNPYNTVSTNLYGMIADEEVAKKVENGEYKVEYKITPNKTKNLYKVSLHKGKTPLS